MSKPVITYALLRELNACDPQLSKFEELFGTKARVEVTVGLCVEHAQDFDWDWAAEEILSQHYRYNMYETGTEDATVIYDQYTSAAFKARNSKSWPFRATRDAALSALAQKVDMACAREGISQTDFSRFDEQKRFQEVNSRFVAERRKIWADFEAVDQPIREQYEADVADIGTALHKVLAEEFAKAFIQQCEESE